MTAVGYVRCSTDEQSPELQRAALRRYADARGWELLRLYEDLGASGASARRPAFTRLMQDAHTDPRGFETVLVWKFDRFSRSVTDLLSSLETFQQLGIDFVSITEGVDTSTAAGRMVFTFLGAVAEFERALIRERVRAGLAAARGRRVRLGRRPVLGPRQLARARRLRAAGTPPRLIARTPRIARPTLRRALTRGA